MKIDYNTFDKPMCFQDLDAGDCFELYTGDYNIAEHQLFMKIDTTMPDKRPNFNCVSLNDGIPFVAKEDDLVKYRDGRFVFNN